jgi:hypothetical protein
MNTFKKDLEFGQKYEDIWVDILNNDYDVIERAPSDKKFSLWDVKTIKDGIEITYEIKADNWATRTNNVAIEFERIGGVKSGLNLSKATFYVIFVIDEFGGYECYKIPRKTLVKMINNGEYKCVRTSYDGSRFVCVEIRRLKQYLYKVVYNDGFLKDD